MILAADALAGAAGTGCHEPPRIDGEDRATRVLVVGSDRRFRSVTGLLLTRRGCAVTLADPTADVAALAGVIKPMSSCWTRAPR